MLVANLSWNPVTTYTDGNPIEEGKVVKYNVYRAENNDLSDSMRVNAAEITDTNYQDMPLQPNKTYYYQVNAYIVPEAQGEKSDAVSIRTLTPGKVASVVVVLTSA